MVILLGKMITKTGGSGGILFSDKAMAMFVNWHTGVSMFLASPATMWKRSGIWCGFDWDE